MGEEFKGERGWNRRMGAEKERMMIKRSVWGGGLVSLEGKAGRGVLLSVNVLCDLASSSQTVDYSSNLRPCQSQPGHALCC